MSPDRAAAKSNGGGLLASALAPSTALPLHLSATTASSQSDTGSDDDGIVLESEGSSSGRRGMGVADVCVAIDWVLRPVGGGVPYYAGSRRRPRALPPSHR